MCEQRLKETSLFKAEIIYLDTRSCCDLIANKLQLERFELFCDNKY